MGCGGKNLYFQEGNNMNFQSDLEMEGPLLNKINLQPDLQPMEPMSWVLAPSCGKSCWREEGTSECRICSGGKVEAREKVPLLRPQHW